jgi:hypothetical protein
MRAWSYCNGVAGGDDDNDDDDEEEDDEEEDVIRSARLFIIPA